MSDEYQEIRLREAIADRWLAGEHLADLRSDYGTNVAGVVTPMGAERIEELIRAAWLSERAKREEV